MIFFIIITILTVSSCAYYFFSPRKEVKKFFIIFLLLSSSSFLLYFFKGNKESFFFAENLKKEIDTLITNSDSLDNFDPTKIVLFLENKLKEEPNDLEGWMILARTCLMTGHAQKADFHYKNGLKYFPNDEDLLYEYAMLKKNTNQFSSAIKYLEKIKKINPQNIDSRKALVEILIQTKQSKRANNEFLEIKELEDISSIWLKKTLEDLD